jgi:hypothetical protein
MTLLPSDSREQVLPSGRAVVVRTQPGSEELEIRSPDGQVELSIVLTPQGPVVRMKVARLELESATTLGLTCERLEVRASGGIDLQTQGGVAITGEELRVKTDDDIHLNGKMIRLNC